MTCNHSRTHYGVCKSCTYEDLLGEEEPCCTCVHRNTQCNWKPKKEISKMKRTKCINETKCRTDKTWCYLCRHMYSSEYEGKHPENEY